MTFSAFGKTQTRGAKVLRELLTGAHHMRIVAASGNLVGAKHVPFLPYQVTHGQLHSKAGIRENL